MTPALHEPGPPQLTRHTEASHSTEASLLRHRTNPSTRCRGTRSARTRRPPRCGSSCGAAVDGAGSATRAPDLLACHHPAGDLAVVSRRASDRAAVRAGRARASDGTRAVGGARPALRRATGDRIAETSGVGVGVGARAFDAAVDLRTVKRAVDERRVASLAVAGPISSRSSMPSTAAHAAATMNAPESAANRAARAIESRARGLHHHL